jgi:phospholysine phosphohistidine inorganic pyrophosphate phosphatase
VSLSSHIQNKNIQLLPEFADLEKSDPNCLVLGDAAEYFNYESMNDAFRFLLENKDAKFFTLGRG